MNYRVPDFELDDIYSLPASSGFTRKSGMPEEDIMELLWQNGQLVAHTQNQRSGRRSSEHGSTVVPGNAESEMRSTVEEPVVQQNNLFMQEDEMASWLHYPIHDSAFERDITQYFNPTPPPPPPPPQPQPSQGLELSSSIQVSTQVPNESVSQPSTVARRPPVPRPSKQKEVILEGPKRVQNFMHFKKLPRVESGSGGSSSSAVVESNDTPKVSQMGSSSVVPEMECVNEGLGTRDLTTSSPGDSSASMSCSVEPPQTISVNEEKSKEAAKSQHRKRKAREADDDDFHTLDSEFEFGGEKKQEGGSTSTKRSRAAEVHNLSERRRRDRINERMKTLQELIPRCNKTDKASMLDEAIEYLKTLQMQVQMMSMGCGMVPIMYPAIQQYMPAMGMGMAMDLSMNRPLVPYPGMLLGSTMPNPVVGPHTAPTFPIPAFHMPVVPDPLSMQAPNTVDPLNSIAGHNQHPNFTNPNQHYIFPQQGQVLIPQQNQVADQQKNAKPSTSREDGKPENHQLGC